MSAIPCAITICMYVHTVCVHLSRRMCALTVYVYMYMHTICVHVCVHCMCTCMLWFANGCVSNVIMHMYRNKDGCTVHVSVCEALWTALVSFFLGKNPTYSLHFGVKFYLAQPRIMDQYARFVHCIKQIFFLIKVIWFSVLPIMFMDICCYCY